MEISSCNPSKQAYRLQEAAEPLDPGPWPEHGGVLHLGASWLPSAPSTWREAPVPLPHQQLSVDPVQDRGFPLELTRKGSATCNHLFRVIEGEHVGVLLWWGVPGYVVHVVVHYSVRKLRRIADDRLEIALGR
ncbi:nucleotide binding [Striga asiatica]|uniref:Nucleotide binding n=1 Tax=Striga asiatica TaxID=4170 RepID=A0A5A7RH92_STRAF|nr:nucleotide binding [Striga asiatica]